MSVQARNRCIRSISDRSAMGGIYWNRDIWHPPIHSVIKLSNIHRPASCRHHRGRITVAVSLGIGLDFCIVVIISNGLGSNAVPTYLAWTTFIGEPTIGGPTGRPWLAAFQLWAGGFGDG